MATTKKPVKAVAVPKGKATFQEVASVLLKVIATLPVAIPVVASSFNIGALKSTAVTAVVGGLVTVASFVQSWLKNNGYLTKATAKVKAVFGR